MLRKSVTVLLVIFLSMYSWGVKVKLFSGEEKAVKSIEFDHNTFNVDGDVYSKDDVKTVYFDKKRTQPKKAPEKIKSGKEYKKLEEDTMWIFDQAKKMQEKYKDASMLYLLSKSEETLEKNGNRRFIYHYIVKILKDDAKHLSKLTASYQKGIDEAKFVRGRCIKNNGTYIDFDPATVKESVQSDSLSSITKNKFVKTAVIPDVETGDFVEIIKEYYTYNPFKKDFYFVKYGFASTVPVYQDIKIIHIPEDQEFYYKTYRMDKKYEKPEINIVNGVKTYKWMVQDVEPYIEENASSSYYEYAPHILCSSLKNWKEFHKWGKQLLDNRVVVTPEVKKKALEIVKGAKNVDEQLARLYHWNQQEIRYLSVKTGIASGWGGHKAEITLKNKYGDCIDKAILFSTMGKALGIDIVPIILLVNTSGKPNYDLPHFNSNHAIVKVTLKDREFYLDATSEDYRYPYFRNDDKNVVVHNPQKLKLDYIPLPDFRDNAMHFLYEMKLKKNGDVDLVYTKRYTGSKEASARSYWKSRNEDTYKENIMSTLNSMNAGTVLKKYKFFNTHDISKPFYYFWEATFKNFMIKAKDLLIFDIPWAEAYFSNIELKERKFDLVYSSTSWVTKKYIIKIPDNMKVKFLPHSYAGWFKDIMFVNSDYSVKDNTVIYYQSIKRLKDRVKPEDYVEYKKFLEDFVSVTKEKLVFEKIEDREGK